MYTGFWLENLRERDYLEDPGVDGRIILKWIFRKWDGVHGLDRSGSGQRQIAGTCKCNNETLGYIKCGEFFLTSWKQVSLLRMTLLHGVGK